LPKKDITSKVWKKVFPQDLGRVILLEEWERHDYLCKIVKGKGYLDHYCGYVGIPRDHPLIKNGAIKKLEVHGGVTFCGDSRGLKLSWGKKLWESPYFWVGFDCSHAGDYSPFYPTGHKWTLGELIKEVNHLADQLWEGRGKKNV